jgi:hypothetical protein
MLPLLIAAVWKPLPPARPIPDSRAPLSESARGSWGRKGVSGALPADGGPREAVAKRAAPDADANADAAAAAVAPSPRSRALLKALAMAAVGAGASGVAAAIAVARRKRTANGAASERLLDPARNYVD